MNEKIYKLAEQAKADSWCFDDVHIPTAFIDSFAEILLNSALDDVNFWYWDNGGDIKYAIQEVKENYGIKE